MSQIRIIAKLVNIKANILTLKRKKYRYLNIISRVDEIHRKKQAQNSFKEREEKMDNQMFCYFEINNKQRKY